MGIAELSKSRNKSNGNLDGIAKLSQSRKLSKIAKSNEYTTTKQSGSDSVNIEKKDTSFDRYNRIARKTNTEPTIINATLPMVKPKQETVEQTAIRLFPSAWEKQKMEYASTHPNETNITNLKGNEYIPDKYNGVSESAAAGAIEGSGAGPLIRLSEKLDSSWEKANNGVRTLQGEKEKYPERTSKTSTEMELAKAANPTAYGIGEMAGTFAKYAMLGQAFPTASGGVTSRIVNNAARLTAPRIVEGAIDVSTGYKDIDEYGREVLKTGVGSIVGSGLAIGTGVASGMIAPSASKYVNAALRGASYSLGYDLSGLGIDMASGVDTNITWKDILKRAGTGALLGVVNQAFEDAKSYSDYENEQHESLIKDDEQYAKKWFDGVNESELRKRYAELAKQYHPDNGGDAETFNEISRGYNYLFEKLRQTASMKFEEAATAKENGDAYGYQKASNELVGMLEILKDTANESTVPVVEEIINAANALDEYIPEEVPQIPIDAIQEDIARDSALNVSENNTEESNQVIETNKVNEQIEKSNQEVINTRAETFGENGAKAYKNLAETNTSKEAYEVAKKVYDATIKGEGISDDVITLAENNNMGTTEIEPIIKSAFADRQGANNGEERNDTLRGERIGQRSISSRESDGSVYQTERRIEEILSESGVQRQVADSETGSLKISEEVEANSKFKWAKRNQKIYFSDETTKDNREAIAIAKNNGLENFEIWYGGEIKDNSGISHRGFVDRISGKSGVQGDNEYFKSSQIARHEVAEQYITDGTISVDDILTKVAKETSQEFVDFVKKIYELTGANAKEMVCDSAGEMNDLMFMGDEYEEFAEVVTQFQKIAKGYIKDVLGDKLDAKDISDDVPKNDIVITPDMALEVDENGDIYGVEFSSSTALASGYNFDPKKYAKELSAVNGKSEAVNRRYIKDMIEYAKFIKDNPTLDYEDSGLSPIVSNSEYGGSYDANTNCTKRRLYAGTLQYIQKMFPNTFLTDTEHLDLRSMMADSGLEVPCAKCYVEGSRMATLSKFNKVFAAKYKEMYPDRWHPNAYDLNTPDGIESVRKNHPECFETFNYFWNHYGQLEEGDKSLFASQQKPKLYQARSAYKNELDNLFKDYADVTMKNLNGGFRFNSFSDFEFVNAIDVMQVITDMSKLGLAGQGYTKQPAFADIYGDTRLKINLSIDAWGLDENGNIIFNDVEGMDHNVALAIRRKHPKDVGTICCVYDDKTLLAALADDRIDFIIPFHRSQWKKSQYKAMGLPQTTKDYTNQQNEKWLEPDKHTHIYRDRVVKTKCTNYMPNEYWDFSKSGKENAQIYLDKCYKDGKRPKFYKLLDRNPNGRFSLKADGSTDGYWKLLIDFKMYESDSKDRITNIGSPQMPVIPKFNMAEVYRLASEYTGGHDKLPVAKGVADKFIKKYKDSHKGTIEFSTSLKKQPVEKFYSKLQNEIEAYKGDKLGANSVESYLKGRGVKEEEIKWSGIRTFLDGKKSVSKSELMDYLKSNELKIEEKVLGIEYDSNNYDQYIGAQDKVKKDAVEILKNQGIKTSIKNIEVEYEGDGSFTAYYDGDRVTNYNPEINKTRWSEYKLKGGTNYREYLYKQPNSDYSNNAMSTHWDKETGVLAHARVQDFNTPDNKKVLFIDEIQSDWHNAGAKIGYGGKTITQSEVDANRRNVERNFTDSDIGKGILEKIILYERINSKDKQIAFRYLSMNTNPLNYLSEIMAVSNIKFSESEINTVSRMKADLDSVQNRTAVPEAPFQKNYTDFVLKNLLREAAEKGYDYLAWTTGKMQEERWSSEYSEGYRIEYDQDIPKFLNKYGKQWGAKVGEIEIDSESESADTSMERYNELKSEWESSHSGAYTIENTGESFDNEDDLEWSVREYIEDNGYRWYDVDIEDYGDYWEYLYDGEEVAKVTINEDSVFPDYNEWVREAQYETITSDYATVPAIPITDDMIDSVLYSGQPMFSTKLNLDNLKAEELAKEYDKFVAKSEKQQAVIDALTNALSEYDWKPDTASVKAIAKELKAWTNSSMKNMQIESELMAIYNEAKGPNVDGERISKLERDLAERLVQEGTLVLDQNEVRTYKNFTSILRKNPILKTPSLVAEFGGEEDFRIFARSVFPRMLFSNTGKTVDDVYKLLNESDNSNFPLGLGEKQELEWIKQQLEDLKPVPRMENVNGSYEEHVEGIVDKINDAFFDVKYNAGVIKATEQSLREQYKKAVAERKAELNNKYNDRVEKAKLRKGEYEARKKLFKDLNKLKKLKGAKDFEDAKNSILNKVWTMQQGISEETYNNLLKYEEEVGLRSATDPDYARVQAVKAAKAIERLHKIHVNEMTMNEVEELAESVSALITYQQTATRTLKFEKGKEIRDIALKVMDQLAETKLYDPHNKVKYALQKYALFTASPLRALPLLDEFRKDGFFTKIMDMFNEGELKAKDHTRKAYKMIEEFTDDDGFVNKLSSEEIEISDSKGNSTIITPDIRAWLYLASRSYTHLNTSVNGGLVFPDIKLYKRGNIKNAYYKSKTLFLTPTQIDEICSAMTEQEKAYAETIWKYYNGGGLVSSKDSTDEVTMQLDGTIKTNVDKYLPALRDKAYIAQDIGVYQDPTLPQAGFIKERNPDANQPIIAEGLSRTFKRSVNQVSRFYGLTIPLRDFNMIYNATFGYGKDSVKKAIQGTFMDAGITYIENLVSDLQRGGREHTTDLLDKIKGLYVNSQFGINGRIIAAQTSSYPMALTVLHADSLMKGLRVSNSRLDLDYIDSITPLYWDRRRGLGGNEVGEIYKDKTLEKKNFLERFRDKATAGIQLSDVFTTGHIISACISEMETYYPEYIKGTKEYDKKLASLINQAFQLTQPSYSIMTKSEFQKRSGLGYQMLNMFKTASLNMGGEVQTALLKAQAIKDANKNGKATDEDVKEAKDGLRNAIVGFLICQTAYTLMKTAYDLIIHKNKRFRDKNGEVTVPSTFIEFGLDLIGNLMGGVYGGSLVYDVAKPVGTALATGDAKFYDQEAPGLNIINDLMETIINFLNSTHDYVFVGNKDAKDSYVNNSAKLSKSLATILGLPANNVLGYVNMVKWYFEDIKNGTLGDAGKGIIGTSDASVTKEQYANRAIDSYQKGNTEKGDKALENTDASSIKKALGVDDANGALKKIVSMDIDSESMMKLLKIVDKTDAELMEKYKVDPKDYNDYVFGNKVPKLSDIKSNGFSSEDKMIESIGSGARGGNWHHIVEENQSKLSGFKSEQINNTNNIVSLPSGAKTVHSALTTYYNLPDDFTDGKTVREWLKGKSFEEQFNFGVKKISEYGKLVAGENGWMFVPNEKAIEEKIPIDEGTGESESVKTKIDSDLKTNNVYDDDRYTYVVDNYSQEEAVEWFESSSQRTSSKAYQAWVSTNRSTWDYVKTRSDLARQTKNSKDKQKTVANYCKNNRLPKANRDIIWEAYDWTVGSKNYKEYFGNN